MRSKATCLCLLAVAMLLIAIPQAALAQDLLTEEFKSPSGWIRLKYPKGWEFIDYDSSPISYFHYLTNDKSAALAGFEAGQLPSGTVYISILEPPALERAIYNNSGYYDSDGSDLSSVAIDLVRFASIGGGSVYEQTSLAEIWLPAPAVRADAHSTQSDLLALAIDHSEGNIVGVLAMTAPGEQGQFEDVILAIAGSIVYRSPWRASLTGHTATVHTIEFAQDGTRLASIGQDKAVRIWDLAAEAELHSLEHPNSPTYLAFSPDGTLLVTGSDDGIVRVWDVATGELRAELAGHEGSIYSVVFSPDGALIASAGSDWSVRLWSFDDAWHEKIVLQGHLHGVAQIAFSPDSSLLAVGTGSGSVILWDVPR